MTANSIMRYVSGWHNLMACSFVQFFKDRGGIKEFVGGPVAKYKANPGNYNNDKPGEEINDYTTSYAQRFAVMEYSLDELPEKMAHVLKPGDELWVYTSSVPLKDNYLNRTIDQPVWNMEMLGWFAFKHHATGYLHWGLNQWNTWTRDYLPFPDYPQDTMWDNVLGDGSCVYPDKENLGIRSSTILFLILPFLILQVCLAAKILGEGEKNYWMGVDLTMERAVGVRQKNLDNIREIENRITANKTLKGFLLVKFTPQNLQYYSSEIQRIINPGAGEEDLYTIRVYYPNETIPRGFNTFYFLRDFAVGDGADFLRSNKISRWVLPQEAGHYSSLYTPYSGHYTYMKKVFAGKRLVYVLTISVPESEMDSFLWDPQEHSLKQKADYSYGKETLTLDYSGNSRHVITRNHQFDDFPQSLTFVFSQNSQEVYVIAIIGAVMLLIAVLIAMVLRLVRNIFQSIYVCLDEFKESADQGFSCKFAVGENNEVARIKEAFNQQIDKIQELLKLTKEQVELVKDSQLMALQHQIDPHFLYNTLEVFSYKMELYHHYEEADAIIAFSKMMRYNVVENSGYATIRQEVDQVENYLCIQRMKYQKITVKLQIPHELYSFEVPRFLFQPLIENSIVHGYYGEALQIVLTCRREEGYIHFQVWDNGQGLDAEAVSRINEAFRTKGKGEGVGIGLMNIHSRLCLFYSDSCGLHIDSVKMKWTSMEFRIPDHGLVE